MLNICMRANFKCTWDYMIARLEANMASIIVRLPQT